MEKTILMISSFLILLAGCTTMEEAQNDGVAPTDSSREETVDEKKETSKVDDRIPAELTVLAENLNIPWSIQKEGDIFYITEREGTIAKIENGKVERHDVQLEEPLSSEAEAGLLGLVLDPDFSENQQAFAYYTYSGNSGPTNRIVRLELAENVWLEREVLVDGIPSGNVHHGGRLAIGPDEKLYATAGDAATPELAQNLNSLAGKILRMNLDGTVPEDNPFEGSYIYSYGHRNPQGLTWLEDGRMYASEHGNQANDEINRIEAGVNYGWPLIEGLEETDAMRAPVFTSGRQETWAPSGMDQHDGKLYAAALRGNAVLEFDLEANEVRALLDDYGRIRDIYIEDDFLYFITNNTDGRGDPIDSDDRLFRIDLTELDESI